MALYHSAKGSVGYDIVGTPTIVNGVVSDFSSGTLTSEQVFSPGSSTWEIGFDFTTGSFTGPQGVITGVGTSDSIAPLFIQSDGRMSFYASSNGSSWDLANQFNIGNIAANTHYFIKEKYTGSEYTIDVWINGVQQTQKVLSTSTPIIGGLKLLFGNNRNTDGADYFRGSINLNSTYIIIDGQPWFGVCPVEVKSHQLMGPVGYTVEGSPTITDGVASNFSSSNYLAVQAPTGTISSFEIVADFTTGASLWSHNQGTIIGQTSNIHTPQIAINNSSQLAFLVPSSSHQWVTVTRLDSMQTNTHYVVKMTWDGTVASAYVKNGSTFELIGSESCPNLGWDGELRIGTDNQPLDFFPGSIDLNNTYIKLNGKLWFWQPRETEKIVVNGVEVWSKPNPLMIPLGLQKVGNPTVQNGIVSGFSASDYLQFTQRGPDFAPGTTMVVKFKIDDANANHGIFGNITPNEKAGISLRTGGNNTYPWAFFAMRGYSSWTNSFNFASQLSTDTWYYLRVSHANNDTSSSSQPYGINFDLSTDGQNWTLWRSGNYPYEATIPTANYCLGCIGDPNTSGVYNVLRGSIDLNETYIEQEVGGQTLRYIPLVQEPSVPTGYTKVGEPVFLGTKVTCTDFNNYLKATQTFSSLANIEIQIKFTTASTYQMQRAECIFVCENVMNLAINTSNYLCCWHWSAHKNYNLLTVSPYTTYYVKMTIGSDGQTRTYSTSTDGSSWTQVAQFVDTSLSLGNDIWFFRHDSFSEWFKGITDLSETYIKIGDQYLVPPAQ